MRLETYWLPGRGPCGSPPSRRNSGPCTRSLLRQRSHPIWSSGRDWSGASHWRRWRDAGPELTAGRCAATVSWSEGCRRPGSGAWAAAPARRWCRWAPGWRRALLQTSHLKARKRTIQHVNKVESCQQTLCEPLASFSSPPVAYCRTTARVVWGFSRCNEAWRKTPSETQGPFANVAKLRWKRS